MKRIAIVVQRSHETVVGGSESLAWHYATLLKDDYHVDLLTTTAVDISEWANVLPEGSEIRDGINVVRFPVTVGRNAYWAQLHDRLQTGFDTFTPGRHRNSEKALLLNWTVPLQEEFIKNQGPYSAPLMEFINDRWREYQAVIFVTYLYPTAYFGLQHLPAGNAFFVPTLHDEQPAYLSAFKHAAERACALLWLTEAEQRVSRKLWGDLPGRVVGMAIDTKLREPEISHVPYMLYCGRVDPNKGCAQLFEFYFKYKRATRSKLRLVITGTEDMEIPRHADIEFRGFVSPEEKFRLMAGAAVYVAPSPNESFSIVTLEAMAQQTPVLASGRSEVMVDHLKRSGAGRIYTDYDTFQAGLSALLRGNGEVEEMAQAGRRYVVSNYEFNHIKSALIDAIESKEKPKPRPKSFKFDHNQFALEFARNLSACAWHEHPLYSPFTQYDQEYYLAQKDAFVHKYRCFYAVSRTISPRSMIELGTSAGASADAYLSASPNADYIGLDVFGPATGHDDNSVWDPYEIAEMLLRDRGFKDWRLMRANLRELERLPAKADLVVVDAAHDFDDEYEDLKLALTADPTFIFVDDADDPEGAAPAIEKFLGEELEGRVEYSFHIPYVGGGLVIKLKS